MIAKVTSKQIRIALEASITQTIDSIEGFEPTKKVSAQVKRSVRELAHKIKANLKKRLKEEAKQKLKAEPKQKNQGKQNKKKKSLKGELVESK